MRLKILKDLEATLIATIVVGILVTPIFLLFGATAHAANDTATPYGREEQAVVLQSYKQETKDSRSIEITVETTNGERLRNTFEFSSDKIAYPNYWETETGDVITVTVADLITADGEVINSEIVEIEEA